MSVSPMSWRPPFEIILTSPFYALVAAAWFRYAWAKEARVRLAQYIQDHQPAEQSVQADASDQREEQQ